MRGSGIGLEESQRALDWMALVLHRARLAPREPAAHPRRRRPALAALRNTMQRAEESWVNDPANAYRMQRHPAYLAADSFLTRTHNALRLRWLLKDPAPATREALDALPHASSPKAAARWTRAELKALLADGKAPAGGALARRNARSPARR